MPWVNTPDGRKWEKSERSMRAANAGLVTFSDLIDGGEQRDIRTEEMRAALASLPPIMVVREDEINAKIEGRRERLAGRAANYREKALAEAGNLRSLIRDIYTPLGGGLHPAQIAQGDRCFYNNGMVLGDADGVAKYRVTDTRGGKLRLDVWEGAGWTGRTERTIAQADELLRPAEIIDCWEVVPVRNPEGEVIRGVEGYAWAAFFTRDGAIIPPQKKFDTEAATYTGFWNRSKSHPGHGRAGYRVEKGRPKDGKVPVQDGDIAFFSDKEDAVQWMVEQSAILRTDEDGPTREFETNLEFRRVIYAKHKRSVTVLASEAKWEESEQCYFIHNWSRSFEQWMQFQNSLDGSPKHRDSISDVREAMEDMDKRIVFASNADLEPGEEGKPHAHLTFGEGKRKKVLPPVPQHAPPKAFKRDKPTQWNSPESRIELPEPKRKTWVRGKYRKVR